MAKVFISYRRDDAQHQADRVHAALKRHVPNPQRDIFIDIDNIPVGVDFVAHLDAKVAECDVLLALIGPNWLEARHPQTGQRRLDDPDDFVRIEIASALKRGIPVAPILLDGTPMPTKDRLPDDLKPLVRRHGVEIRRNTFDGDTERMIRGLSLKRIKKRTEPKGIAWDNRLGLAAAAALVVAVGGTTAVFWPRQSPTETVIHDPSVVPVTGPRLALVISQTTYNDTTISFVDNAREEGDLIEAALKKIGFASTRVNDVSKVDLEKALDGFRKALADAGRDAVGFVYYTGHGIQHPNHADNFLLGVDANLNSAADIERYGVSLTAQRDLLGAVGAKGVFLVFDACRNVPPVDLWSSGTTSGYMPPTKGLAPIRAPLGMLVAYATQEGDFAQEGIFAPILAEELVRPNQRIETVFMNTKDRVAQESKGDQLPWYDPKVYGLCLTCSIERD